MAFSGSGSGKGKRAITDINVTPFVDIVLVLLVIFMVTASFIGKGQIPVNLPKAGTAEELSKGSLLILGIDSRGTWLLKGQALSDDEIKAQVRVAVQENPDVEAVIAGDKAVPYGRVMELIDTLRTLGVKRFAAEVEPKSEK